VKSIARPLALFAFVIATGVSIILWNLHSTRAAGQILAGEARAAQQGADQGDSDSQYNLGQMYSSGSGVPQNYGTAEYWYQKAAAQGLAKAELAIGDLYFDGNGVPQNYADALVWYRKAADKNYPMAEQAMGKMNFFGDGVPQSYLGAMAWYRKSADQGTAKSENDVGYLYRHGLGVARDEVEAERWFLKAARQGHEDAQRALGLRLSPLKPWSIAGQLTLLAGCLLLLSGFITPMRLGSDENARWLAFAGVLGCLEAGMYLYGHSKYGLFPSAALAMAFRGSASFFGGIALGLFVTTLRPKSEKFLLLVSGLLAVAAGLGLFAIARFDDQPLTGIGWRIVVLAACPLGMALSAAISSRRNSREQKGWTAEAAAGTRKLTRAS
jgi:TPR repeat protein